MLQLVHKNMQVGMCGLLKPIPPGMHTVRAGPNPPSMPTFLMSLFFMYLLIFIPVIGNLEQSYFYQTWLNLVNRFQSSQRRQTYSTIT